MANINKIRLSGQTYNIEDVNASKTVELTQAQYDALTVKDPNTFYVITDAQGADLSNYYTKSETSGATEISTALNTKQDTLVSGTNIKTINNESILGSGNITIQGGGGGGKAIEAGRGISITTGETADTVSFNLPISAGTGTNSVREGYNTTARGNNSHAEGNSSKANGDMSHAEGLNTTASSYSHSEGYETNANGSVSHTEGIGTITNNTSEHASGQYNVSSKASDTFGDSGNTLFSVGNGTSNSARHNAFEIRQNGDIYITSGGTDIKLQDNLGGGGGGASYSAGDGIDITNNVISVTGKQDTLISGTNIKTINNESLLGSGNITIQGGGGGGKAIEAGRGIAITTGATADTVSFNLPISAGTGSNSLAFGRYGAATGQYSTAFGNGSQANNNYAFAIGNTNYANGSSSFAGGDGLTSAIANGSFAFGYNAETRGVNSVALGGYFLKTNNGSEFATGKANVSNTGSTDADKTLFSVGNGTNSSNRHNAFEIRQNGDIYLNDGSKLQDTVSATTANTTALGGLKLVKLTQSEYDSLSTYDSNTLYVIVN